MPEELPERVTRLLGESYRAKGFEEVAQHVEYVLATPSPAHRKLFAEALPRSSAAVHRGRGGCRARRRSGRASCIPAGAPDHPGGTLHAREAAVGDRFDGASDGARHRQAVLPCQTCRHTPSRFRTHAGDWRGTACRLNSARGGGTCRSVVGVPGAPTAHCRLRAALHSLQLFKVSAEPVDRRRTLPSR